MIRITMILLGLSFGFALPAFAESPADFDGAAPVENSSIDSNATYDSTNGIQQPAGNDSQYDDYGSPENDYSDTSAFDRMQEFARGDFASCQDARQACGEGAECQTKYLECAAYIQGAIN